MNTKLQKLEQKFETVSKKIEVLEIQRDEYISEDRCTLKIDDKIYFLEGIQYEIQLKIEKL